MRFSPHIAIQVQDSKKALSFYRDVMGFEFAQDKKNALSKESGIHLKSGNINFWIDEGSSEATYLEFACENFSEKLKELVSSGCEVIQTHNETSVILKDPYGMRFHLFEQSDFKRPELTDTMISARDHKKLVTFYQNWGSFIVVEESNSYTNLKNPFTLQTLCLTNGESVSRASPGFATRDLIAAIESLKQNGGKVLKTWEFGSMKGANCADPEGNEIMLWQGSHS